MKLNLISPSWLQIKQNELSKNHNVLRKKQTNKIKNNKNNYLINQYMLSQVDKQFLKKEFRILRSDIQKWGKEEFFRLLALLKLPESIQKQFFQLCVDRACNKNLNNIFENIQSSINERNYFPFHKVKFALNLISNNTEEDSSNLSLINKHFNEYNQQLNFSQDSILALVEALDKIHDTFIIELTSQQIFTITKNIGLNDHAAIIKKYNIDGFNIVCSLSDLETLKDIRNYFKGEDIQKILQITCLYMTQYFRQNILQEKRRKTSTLSKKNVTQFQEADSMKNQMKQFVIQSHQIIKKSSEDQIQIDPTQLQPSSYGESAIGSSQIGQSQFATSERGSIYAQSEYANSVRGSVDCRMSFRVGNNDGRASMMYNSEIITELRQACLNLPFDLLNLQPLQQIRIRALKNAFGREVDKDVWMFSVQGAKLGRDKQNDIRFPDELSISSKHAQIVLKAQNFYLQDLGSKTGTYLKIQKNTVIQDETCIQFSTEVQIVFRINKKAPNQGVIKVEIKKPENLPDYKISLREGYKIKIGRSDRCHIRINNPSMAEKHSEIFYKDSTFFFKNCHASFMSWLRLSQKSVRSQVFRLNPGQIFRLSSKKSFIVEDISNQLLKNQAQKNNQNQIIK